MMHIRVLIFLSRKHLLEKNARIFLNWRLRPIGFEKQKPCLIQGEPLGRWFRSLTWCKNAYSIAINSRIWKSCHKEGNCSIICCSNCSARAIALALHQRALLQLKAMSHQKAPSPQKQQCGILWPQVRVIEVIKWRKRNSKDDEETIWDQSS